MLVYMITNGVFKSINLIAVLYLERSIEKQGLGVSAQAVSFLTMVSIIPSTSIIFLSPLFVPKNISY